jgi:hypothetical protein
MMHLPKFYVLNIRVRNEEVLHRVKERRNILHTINTEINLLHLITFGMTTNTDLVLHRGETVFLLGSEPHTSKWKDGSLYLLSQPLSVDVPASYVSLPCKPWNQQVH